MIGVITCVGSSLSEPEWWDGCSSISLFWQKVFKMIPWVSRWFFTRFSVRYVLLYLIIRVLLVLINSVIAVIYIGLLCSWRIHDLDVSSWRLDQTCLSYQPFPSSHLHWSSKYCSIYLFFSRWDIIAERLGFMLVFGDLLWIPFTFSIQACNCVFDNEPVHRNFILLSSWHVNSSSRGKKTFFLNAWTFCDWNVFSLDRAGGFCTIKYN